MQIIYKDTVIDVKKGTKICDLLKDEIAKSDNKVIACRFNNEVRGLNCEINANGKIELIDVSTKDGMRIYQRGIIYIVCRAIEELYPEVHITVNYQLYHGMFCEVDNVEITEQMIKNIKKRVKEIVEENSPIERRKMTREEALEFYDKNKTLKGKLQLNIKDKKYVTLYYNENYYSYFYGVMPIRTGILDVFDIKKYDKGFLIRFPSRKNPNKLPEKIIKNDRLLETLKEYEELHRVLDVHTLYGLNKSIIERDIKQHILLDEALHEKKIAGIADKIYKNKKLKVVLIAGPSSSGKTTFAKRLEIELKINGIKPKIISVDNYFVDREKTPKDSNGNYDFECIEALKLDLLNKDLMDLLKGKEIEEIVYNFQKGTSEKTGKKLKLEENEVLVLEGIHCLNDKLTYLIPKENKFKIYISALTVLNIDYFNRISTADTRLIRRIVRDNTFRGYDAVRTIALWNSVRKGESKNIFPYQEEADVMFNSSLIYELAVLKKYALPLLKRIDKSQKEYSEAKRLCTLLRYFEDIEDKDIPSNSLLREFIGGSIFE